MGWPDIHWLARDYRWAGGSHYETLGQQLGYVVGEPKWAPCGWRCPYQRPTLSGPVDILGSLVKFVASPASLLCLCTGAAGIRVVAVKYRLAPEHPYPAALNDCYAVYNALLETYNPKHIVIFGESAGGALALATLLRTKAAEQPLPAALAVLSPWADVTMVGDTYDTLAAVDPLLTIQTLKANAEAYVSPGVDPKDPLVSPVYGGTSYSGDWPPTLVTVGTRDMLLSCAFRLYRVLKDAGAQVELSGWEGMWHSFHYWLDMPEGVGGAKEMAQFLGKHLQ